MISIADGIGLLIGIVVIAIIADRLRIAYPILLVMAGIAVALLPVKHRIELQPDLVLLVFLPPLIYDASLDTSARELRTHLRPILLLAVGLVVATMATVAVVIHSLVGGMSWAVAFALGAIVSPPDSVAATQIAGKLGLPRRLVIILGGEGLMNDATALTAYQVAIAAVGTVFTAADVVGQVRLRRGGGGGHRPRRGLDRMPHAPLHRDAGDREHHAVDPPLRRLPPGRQARRLGGAGRRGHRPLLRPLRIGVADGRGPAPATGDLGPDRLPA